MNRILKTAVISGFLGLLVMGCSQSPDKAMVNNNLIGPFASKMLPEGAVLESATLNIFVTQANGQPIFIHRITSEWDEMTVTFNSFGAAFDASVSGSFTADGTGWRTADISDLVEGWLAGDYPDFGLLLDQDEFNIPRAKYLSRENPSNRPYLMVCYNLDGVSECTVFEDVADTYIWEIHPDNNYGTDVLLYTGWVAVVDKEKQSLLRFDVEPTPHDGGGCTRTIGYWKTHAGFGPQADMVTPLLPIWLGDAGGSKSLLVDDAAMAVDILKMSVLGSPSNGITKLYAQLLGAKLNIAADASFGDISETIDAADAFLAGHGWTSWSSLSRVQKNMVLGWQSTLDDYNNGLIGPGHCDDIVSEE